MKKISTMFVRDAKDRSRIVDVVSPGCEWAAKGEGVATVKWDGTACLIRGGRLFKRYDAKNGKTPPPGFECCEAEPDQVTGHWPGWLPVGDEPESKWHREAMTECSMRGEQPPDGTYELIGPKVQGNPYGVGSLPSLFNGSRHFLIKHGQAVLTDVPRSYEDLREYLRHHPMEGIVFHHPDGRMAKVKTRDFGLPWPVKR